MLQSWFKSRCSRLTTSSSEAYKGSVSFNQLYHHVLLSIFNPNLPYQMGVVFMETPFSQQVHLTLPRFLTLFLKVSFSLFLSYLYAHFSHLKILSIMHLLLAAPTFFFLSLPLTPLSSQLTPLGLSWPISMQIHLPCIPSPNFFCFSRVHIQETPKSYTKLYKFPSTYLAALYSTLNW